MASIIKLSKVLRNNWKKSIFAAAACSYGISYIIDSYNKEQLMRKYCREAAFYGDQPLAKNAKPQCVTVVLNPISKKRKAKKLFEKYCEPLLHLAGFAVTIIQTQSENQARYLMANLDTHTDILVVAGGDGTTSDVVTGIMRKYKNNISLAKDCPIGILPLGESNNFAKALFCPDEYVIDVKQLLEATMAVVRGKVKHADVIKVELLETDPERPSEPIYALSTVEWGAWKDAYSRVEKYWYWSSLKRYVTYIFNGYKSDINWCRQGTIRYSDPCKGCCKCYNVPHVESASSKRWWYAYIPKLKSSVEDKVTVDYSKVVNDNCGKMKEIPVSTTELNIINQNIDQGDRAAGPSMKIQFGPESVSYPQFVLEGFRRSRGERPFVNKTLEAQKVELYPPMPDNEAKKRIFYIDNEEFELKPVKLELLSGAIRVFCLENSTK